MDLRPNKAKRAWRKWLLYALYAAVFVAVLWGLRRTFANALEEFRRLRQEEAGLQVSLPLCTLAGVCYFLGFLPAGWFWYRVLRWLGQPVTFFAAFRAYTIGQLGKYVPGKAWVVVLRAGFVQKEGVQPAVSAASVFLETLTMMAVGAAWAAAYLVLTARNNPQLFWAALIAFFMVAIPTLPPFFRPILQLLARKVRRLDVLETLTKIGFAQLWQGWLAMAGLWLLFGVSLGFTLQALGMSPGGSLQMIPNLVASTAFATVGGFLVIILPGGLGARELLLVAILSPYLARHPELGLGTSHDLLAILAAGLLRIIWLFTEVVAAGILWILPYGIKLCFPKTNISNTIVELPSTPALGKGNSTIKDPSTISQVKR